MRYGVDRLAVALVSAALLVPLPRAAAAQDHPAPRGVAVEVEPVAYTLGGGGGTVGYRSGVWSVSVEGFTLTVPESLHGNAGFEAATAGAELQVERFLAGSSDGFYVGSEVGVTRLEVTHEESGASERRVGISVGARLGYEWRTGLGGLYLSPVAGVSYSLTSGDLPVGGETFERTPATPWATIGVGWFF